MKVLLPPPCCVLFTSFRARRSPPEVPKTRSRRPPPSTAAASFQLESDGPRRGRRNACRDTCRRALARIASSSGMGRTQSAGAATINWDVGARRSPSCCRPQGRSRPRSGSERARDGPLGLGRRSRGAARLPLRVPIGRCDVRRGRPGREAGARRSPTWRPCRTSQAGDRTMSRSWETARSFLEQLEARGGREGAVLAGEFSDIRARSTSWKTDKIYPTEAGCQPENVKKNRYKDVVPYDQTRVILTLLQEEGHGDYINGSFIRGIDGSQAYIATQGPLPHTLLDFWRLVWEFGVKVILMACREMENGRRKCERYWAQEQEPLQIGLFYITLKREKRLNADIILRTLQVTFQKESRSVHQLQYISWPDRGVPSHPEHVLTMVEEAHRLQGAGPSPPLCVHCSAGCGRTGVLCTVDYVRQLLLTQTIPPNFSLFDIVLDMRKQRPSFVQTEEQYRFLYHTVSQMFLSALQNANAHNQNLKEVSRPLPNLHHQYPQRPPPRAENCTPLYDDVLSLPSSLNLLAADRPPDGVLRSISVPGPLAVAMSDTYAAVQKRGTPTGSRGSGAEVEALYSQVTPRALRGQARAGDEQGAPPSRVPANQNSSVPGAYEDVANGVPNSGLGFNLRIGKPKGPRDPPAEWTRV